MAVGTTGWFGARPAPAPVVRVFSTLIDRARVPAAVDINGARLAIPIPASASSERPQPHPAGDTIASGSDWIDVPLIELAWARSGDKGDAFNIGVIARKPEFLSYIRSALSEQRVSDFFAHEFEGATSPSVTRYEMPGLNGLNFHLRQSLGGGQMGTLRLDALAKGKAQQLLDIEIPIPPNLTL